MDICVKCQFDAIHPYSPSINATELLRSGFSSFDVCHASIANDITHLERELQKIEPLFLEIRDRHNQIVKDLTACRSLLAPIRRLPREKLLQIFGLLSVNNPNLFDVPWILGHVCSTLRAISRSSPSLWTKIQILPSSSYSTTFLQKYSSLSRGQPIQLAVECDSEYPLDPLTALVPYAQSWSSLDLRMNVESLSQFLSWISVPALHLNKINISLIGRLDRKVQSVAFNNPFSAWPITEASLERIPYSYLPISLVNVQNFHVYSYGPLEIHDILQHSRHLTEVVITPAPPSVSLNINPLAIACTRVDHISLRQLSFVLTRENARQVTKIPVALDYLTFPALQKLHILTLRTELLQGILPGKSEPVEYSRIINLHRSECNLTEITFSVPVPVNSFLIPILRQSPALQNLDIFVDIEIAGSAFRALTLSEGNVPNLKTLRIEDVPCGRVLSGLLHEGDVFHEMVISRLAAGNRLERLRISLGTRWFHHRQFIPVAPNSRIRNLLKLKEEGLDVEFLLDRTDCLIEGEARNRLFGSM